MPDASPPPAEFFVAFPFVFAAMWFAVTSLLGLLSGWYGLMRLFPDEEDQVLAKFGGQSGSMGPGVGMNGILTLSACRGGLRVGIWRIFGPFCAPFYVPWRDLTVRRRRLLVFERADLVFGDAGKLTIAGDLADRIARAADRIWPEPGPPPRKDVRRLALQALAEWLLITAFAAAFFTLGPLLFWGRPGTLPPGLAVAFPAVVFGVVTLVRFLRRLD